jgi:catechol 2,3-dioxygenase-like lactoylglutathione lyase family enzyme
MSRMPEDSTVRRVTIDHLNLPVSDLERSRAFYEAALAPLGMRAIKGEWSEGGSYDFGPPGGEDFCLVQGDPGRADVHVAFAARSREEVDAFHAAAVAAGGTDNGAPGVREQYSPRYYGAFVLDPDGYNVEAVHHAPKDES